MTYNTETAKSDLRKIKGTLEETKKLLMDMCWTPNGEGEELSSELLKKIKEVSDIIELNI